MSVAQTVPNQETRPAPTPGPYQVIDGHVYAPWSEPKPFTDKEGVRHEGFRTGLIAIVYGTVRLLGDGEDGDSEANARLLAASADMLAVLRDLEWIGMNDGCGVTHAMCPACSALKSRGSGHNPYCGLAAAIAKAERR